MVISKILVIYLIYTENGVGSDVMNKTKKPVFYSDLSPIKKAWRALWEKPRGNQSDAIELNRELIKKIIEDERKEQEQKQKKIAAPPTAEV